MMELFDVDAIDIEVTVEDEASGSARDLTNATLIARARRKNGPSFALGTTVMDQVGGVVRIRVEPPSLGAGEYRLQLRVESGLDVQVVLDELFRVKEAI